MEMSCDERVLKEIGVETKKALPKETNAENSSGAKIIDNVSAVLKSSHSDIEVTNGLSAESVSIA